MPTILTLEAARAIGEFLLQYGWGGIVIIFLYEERRRLVKKVDILQLKYDASLEARVKANTDALEIVKNHENKFNDLQRMVTSYLIGKGRSDA